MFDFYALVGALIFEKLNSGNLVYQNFSIKTIKLNWTMTKKNVYLQLLNYSQYLTHTRDYKCKRNKLNTTNSNYEFFPIWVSTQESPKFLCCTEIIILFLFSMCLPFVSIWCIQIISCSLIHLDIIVNNKNKLTGTI